MQGSADQRNSHSAGAAVVVEVSQGLELAALLAKAHQLRRHRREGQQHGEGPLSSRSDLPRLRLRRRRVLARGGEMRASRTLACPSSTMEETRKCSSQIL